MSDATEATESVYRASPECRERGCHITLWQEPARAVLMIHHGEQPRETFEVTRFAVQSAAEDAIWQRFRTFTEGCHRVEDGLPPA